MFSSESDRIGSVRDNTTLNLPGATFRGAEDHLDHVDLGFLVSATSLISQTVDPDDSRLTAM